MSDRVPASACSQNLTISLSLLILLDDKSGKQRVSFCEIGLQTDAQSTGL